MNEQAVQMYVLGLLQGSLFQQRQLIAIREIRPPWIEGGSFEVELASTMVLRVAVSVVKPGEV